MKKTILKKDLAIKLAQTEKELGEYRIKLVHVQIILKRLLRTCPVCHQPASQFKWNSERYMVCCDNSMCKNFRTPLPGSLTRNEFEQFKEITKTIIKVAKDG